MSLLLHPNLAQSAKYEQRVKDDVLPLAEKLRQEKNGLWRPQSLRYERIWGGLHDSNAYRGRNRLYLTTGRRIIENWVQKLKADMFPPSGKYFAVVPDLVTDDDKIPTLTALYTRFVLRNLRLRQQMSPWLRTLVTTGTNFFEMGWEVREALMPMLDGLVDETTGEMTQKTVTKVERVLQDLGPTLRPVSPYLVYVSPYTAMRLEDAELIVEDFLMDQATLTRLAHTPIHPKYPDLGNQIERDRVAFQELRKASPNVDPDRWQAEQVRFRERGFRSRSEAEAKDPGRPFDVSRFYWKTQLDDDPEPQWYQGLVTGAGTLLQLRKAIHWDLLPPVLHAVFLRREHEFWGIPLPAVFDHLQYFLNDTLNQTGDGLVFALNPITAIDPAMVQEPTSVRHKPGARWLVRNPRESISMLEPPKETAMTGMATLNTLIALMNDVANVAPYGGAGITGPRARGKAVNTATGASIITSEAQLQVREVESGIEDDFLNPMLRKMHALTLQCLDRPLLLRLDGKRGAPLVQMKLVRTDLLGRFDFQWLGSTTSYNQQVRSQQRLQFLQIASRIPPELLQAAGKRIDFVELLEGIWADFFDTPSVDRIIKDITPTTSIDPRIENDLFRQGLGAQVAVSPSDNHQQHLRTHDLLLGRPDLHPMTAEDVQRHMQEHMQTMVMALVQQQLQQQQAQQPGPGAPGGGNRLQLGSGQQPGRMASTTSPDDVMRRASRGPALPGAS